MSSKNSEVDHNPKSLSKKASSLRSRNSIEQERRRKLVKFNAVAEIKELSEDSNDSKVNLGMNAMDVDGGSTVSKPATSTGTKDRDTNISFHSKRRSHYKNEFTNSKTNKDTEQSD